MRRRACLLACPPARARCRAAIVFDSFISAHRCAQARQASSFSEHVEHMLAVVPGRTLACRQRPTGPSTAACRLTRCAQAWAAAAVLGAVAPTATPQASPALPPPPLCAPLAPGPPQAGRRRRVPAHRHGQLSCACSSRHRLHALLSRRRLLPAGNIGSLSGASSGGYGASSLAAGGGALCGLGLGGSSGYSVSRRWDCVWSGAGAGCRAARRSMPCRTPAAALVAATTAAAPSTRTAGRTRTTRLSTTRTTSPSGRRGARRGPRRCRLAAARAARTTPWLPPEHASRN